MNVFELHGKLVHDYSSYVRSFINIRDTNVQGEVERALDGGLLWPEPLVQLNPAFEPGPWIDEMVDQNTLHDECRRVFRLKSTSDPEGRPLRLHKHQADAVHAAASGKNYVLTTGTGSGKSLSYIIPIVDFVLKRGTGKGIQAIVVYPMNALANSQLEELKKFLQVGYPEGQPPVTFARYTGQEREERRDIIEHPPDILLTNFVMLELILTRPREHKLIAQARGLRFLVLDELHTYRGRQGADVAMLVRRVRELLSAPDLQCVGTSATLAGPGTPDDQRRQVGEVASRLFGGEVAPERVIMETLQRQTAEPDLADAAFVASLKARVGQPVPVEHPLFVTDPLARWLESVLGVSRSGGHLHRADPRSVVGKRGVAAELAELTGLPEPECRRAVEDMLLAGYRCKNPQTGFPVFAFRLHQFFSRGDTVYASLEHDNRHITMNGQQFVPGDRARVLFPLVFCRECGQEYYCVRQATRGELRSFSRRQLSDRFNDVDEGRAGFLFHSPEWPEDEQKQLDRLPDDWVEEKNGMLRIKPDRRKNAPERLSLDTLGGESPAGAPWYYIPAPFRFCLHCGVTYSPRQQSDFGKLTTLGSEGRSTATTILSLSCVRNLREDPTLLPVARKLLSFTDNRQDASLQAGHFNDFVEVGLLRSALYKAVEKAGAEGIRHEYLTQRVFEALALPLTEFAIDPSVVFNAKTETERALREVIGYRLYRDLERGWRITSPNLEQCGLLEIHYDSLDELCASEEHWARAHPALRSASPATRARVARSLLDYMRRELAIKVDYLDPLAQERIQRLSTQRLIEPWAIDSSEKLERATVLFPRASTSGDTGEFLFVSARGSFGLYLKRPATLPEYGEPLTSDAVLSVLRTLLEVLRVAGLVEAVIAPRSDGDVAGWQVPASAMVWRVGEGRKALHDPVQVPRASTEGGLPNPFFVDFYRTVAATAVGLKAREHTAQVESDERQHRENLFREAKLPILYCSPTMELGVDISQLNAVNMRNVPPTPANYAQRSGRAGRSGQPALVFTYCTSGSPHDQYFFKRPDEMVAGKVAPPRLDLSNEDLISAHVRAIWLAMTQQSLGEALVEILTLEGQNPTLALRPEVRANLEQTTAREKARIHAQHVLDSIRDHLEASSWYRDDWLDEVLDRVVNDLDDACGRWRSLWRAAKAQRDLQDRLANDFSLDSKEREIAKRLRHEAEVQLQLLHDRSDVRQSDFYSYRYFASEGFLPGYNFPRLPLSAFIPARQKNGKDQFISRPRFLAISEFGPRSVIYHEGSRYVINKVILPARGAEMQYTSIKQCSMCGYLHHIATPPGPDLCEHCGETLDMAVENLLRLQNVATRRRDRISSDEEERVRMGFEVKTGIQFSVHDGRKMVTQAVLHGEEGPLAYLTYGHATNIWRINFGWRRRKNRDEQGFVIDTERGYWQANSDLADAGEDRDDELGRSTRRVIPYVEDHRNCLLLRTAAEMTSSQLISLRAALKNGIQVVYQIEDNELAAEMLPSIPPMGPTDYRPTLLFYEAAEGGAGVLRTLVEDPDAIRQVARAALEVCHFDPSSGEDRRRGPRAREDCEAACYDCLMSYGNQPEHLQLDRQAIREPLLALMSGRLETLETPLTCSEKASQLATGDALLDSWLQVLVGGGWQPPDSGGEGVTGCAARPDFTCSGPGRLAAIYVDGDDADRATRDKDVLEDLEDVGYMVIRFGPADKWVDTFRKYPGYFGTPPAAPPAPPPPPPETFDLDLFPAAWRSFAESASRKVKVEPGEDVAQDGKVVGRYVARLGANGSSLFVIDRSDVDAEQVQARLEGAGGKTVCLSPDEALTQLESITDGLRRNT